MHFSNLHKFQENGKGKQNLEIEYKGNSTGPAFRPKAFPQRAKTGARRGVVWCARRGHHVHDSRSGALAVAHRDMWRGLSSGLRTEVKHRACRAWLLGHRTSEKWGDG
jgi:hypothetical protein